MKKTGYLLAFVMFGWLLTVQAQYITPGNNLSLTLSQLVAQSGGVVTFNNSTYFINNTLTISATDTLRIDQPAVIRTAAGIRLEVLGTIRAIPETGQVVFTAIDTLSASNNFKGFRFEDSPENQFHHTHFTHSGGIQLLNSDATFENCIFIHNGSSNVSATITYSGCSPYISHCRFVENERSAIGSGANVQGSPHILYSEFIHNTTDNSNRPQINLGPGSTDTLYIIGNYIEGLNDNVGGIGLSNLVGAGTTKAVISGNTIVGNRYGLAQIGNDISSRITDNIILDNNIQNQPNLGGSGLNFQAGGSGNIAIVRRNLIAGNLWGATIIDQAQPNFGSVSNQGGNVFYDNGNSGQTYALYNNTALPISATGNYWGTNDALLAEDFIFHQADDPSLGLVTFNPINTLIPTFLSFAFLAEDNPQLSNDINGSIDGFGHSVTFEFEQGIDITALIPQYVVELGVTGDPETGIAQNFTGGVVYTLSLPDGTMQDWNVTIEQAPASYSLNFIVKDENENPLEGALIEIAGVGSETTNANGSVVFENLVSGSYNYDITLENYYPYSGTAEIVDENVTESVTLALITDIHASEIPDVQLFPNPATSFVNINVSRTDHWQLEIIDSKGLSQQKSSFFGKRFRVALDELRSGIYVLRLQAGNHTIVKTFSKQ